MFVPFNWNAVRAFIFAAERVAVVPLSVRERRVFGEPSASLMVNTPFVPAVASVRVGVAFERVNGEADERVTVPDAAIVVAPAIAPALVIPPVLLSIPPVIVAPPAVTVKSPPIVWPTVKLLSCPLYATLLSVPVVLMLVPLSKKAVDAFIFAAVRVALVPLSTSVKSVLGIPLESLIVSVPAEFAAPRVTTGLVFESAKGDAADNVTRPEAAIVVAPEIAPAFVITPELLLIPPVTDAPPAEIQITP